MLKYKLLSAVLAISIICASCSNKNIVSPNRTDEKIEQSEHTAEIVDDPENIQENEKKEYSAIVVLSPTDAEILYALGAQDKIIALGEFCSYPEEVSAKPKIATGEQTNIEQIISLNPDCVIMTTMAQEQSHAEKLKQAGIDVIISDSESTVDSSLDNIIKLGELVDKHDEAKKMTDDIRSGLNSIGEHVGEIEKMSVYVEISPIQYGLWTCGNDTFQNEIMDYAMVNNSFNDVQGWQEISQESVIERNPDVIITMLPGDDSINEIMGRKGWEHINAVANGEVYYFDQDLFTRGGPRMAEAAQELHKLIYKID